MMTLYRRVHNFVVINHKRHPPSTPYSCRVACESAHIAFKQRVRCVSPSTLSFSHHHLRPRVHLACLLGRQFSINTPSRAASTAIKAWIPSCKSWSDIGFSKSWRHHVADTGYRYCKAWYITSFFEAKTRSGGTLESTHISRCSIQGAKADEWRC